MRDKDLISLEEAYKVVEEKGFRSMAAAAAMGLSNLAHGQMTPDDYADRANPHTATDSVTSHAQAPKEDDGETNWHKAQVAVQKAISQKGRNVDEHSLELIAGDKETAERYGLYLLQMGLPIPSIIKNASKEKIGATERDFASSHKN